MIYARALVLRSPLCYPGARALAPHYTSARPPYKQMTSARPYVLRHCSHADVIPARPLLPVRPLLTPHAVYKRERSSFPVPRPYTIARGSPTVRLRFNCNTCHPSARLASARVRSSSPFVSEYPCSPLIPSCPPHERECSYPSRSCSSHECSSSQ